MIGNRVRIMYFDRSIIRMRWKNVARTPITRWGLLIRKIARGSIRRVKTHRPSRPGSPPRSRNPAAPFKLIFSVPIRSGTGAVIGMIGFRHGGHPVPGMHEHGDTLVDNTIVRKAHRPARDSVGRFVKRRKITAKNWEHIKRKKPIVVRQIVRYPQRPFMQPALMKSKSKAPSLWANSIR